jgi:UDP-glucose 4-epimerase
MRVIVTGGAGFIGSSVVDGLLARRHEVVVLDNFSTGDHRFLEGAREEGVDRLSVVEIDLFGEAERLRGLLDGADVLVHLAANADVRFGWDHPRRDIDQNLLVTHQLLDAARSVGLRRVIFSSTGSVYGEAQQIPTPENAEFPVQTSLYGASKAAAEGLLAAYAEGAEFAVTVFRFVSVLGPRYTHGHVVDFVRQLTHRPDLLTVLGNGTQRKSYMDVSDCVEAVTTFATNGRVEPGFEVFNLGNDAFCTVRDSVGWITERMGLDPAIDFGTEDRGWVGDNPFIYLDTARVRATGWEPRFTIRESVERTVDYLLENRWVVERGMDER